MYDYTITLFNFCDQDAKWYPAVVDGVSLFATDSGTRTSNSGTASSSAVEINMTCDSNRTIHTTAGSKRYISPKEYARSEAPTSYFTAKPERDFFFIGEYDDLNPVSDSDFGEGFYSAMNASYDGVYMIQSVGYFSLIPHFEIGGR